MEYPSFLNLTSEEWEKRIKLAYKLLNPCRVCPRECHVNRLDPQDPKLGFCQMKTDPVISSHNPHYGEERCLSGTHGSGTIFFTSCNLACVFCQNWEISQLRVGSKTTVERLAQIMLELQKMGCHNINFVSPTIWVPQIIKATHQASKQGLKIPLVYNTGGYDAVETLKLLDGIVDIYMPDIKYSNDQTALKYSNAPRYWTAVQKAIAEMHRQVGDLMIEGEIAKRGLLVRHLVLPNNLAGTKKVMEFLAQRVSQDTYVNLMAQYYSVHRAYDFPELSRRITQQEYEKALRETKTVGIHRFDKIRPGL